MCIVVECVYSAVLNSQGCKLSWLCECAYMVLYSILWCAEIDVLDSQLCRDKVAEVNIEYGIANLYFLFVTIYCTLTS